MEQKLVEGIADVLEVETGDLSLDTDFREDKFEFDSLKGYAILVTIEDDFGYKMSVDDFIASKTIRDLYDKIQAAAA
ncbi:MAG: acyl carrier protein [Clostridiales Family XIII bacterium]|nr:acyl carrier protein [Clostridiales Family XIII bacterium]